MLCRRCGATIHDGLRVCPHCGERQTRQPAHVSCAHCRHKTSAASSICPRCGHVLRARRLSGGVLATVGLLLVASLAVTAGVASRQWSDVQETAQQRLALIETGISELGGKVLDTASSLAVTEVDMATATPTPVVVLAVLPEADRVAAAPLQPDIVLAPTTVVGAVGGGPSAIAATATVAAPAEASPTAAPTETPAAPTATAQPTPVPATPTATEPPPTNTPTLPPTPTKAPATPTPEAVAAAAAAPSGGGPAHTVLAGDNWYSIARRYGITQETLAAYNNSRPSDVLQVGQVLRVPAAGTVVSVPTSTPAPVRPTATPAAATPTAPAATPTPDIPVVVHLAAPSLLSPMTGDGFAAGAQPVLSWRPVTGLGPEDYYYVLVRYTTRDGQPGYMDDRITSTSYAVPIWVYDVASPPDRLGVWSVQVRRMGPGNQEIEISPPSENRTYYWR